MKRRTTLAAACAAAFLLTACGSTTTHDMSSMNHDMAGMNHGSGLSEDKGGYELDLKSAPMSGMAMPVRFSIIKDGKPVTSFTTEQTKQAHFYLIRSDLSGFQHLHPTMAPDGTWSVTVGALPAGTYRLYVQVEPTGVAAPLVLSKQVTIGGSAAAVALPPASLTTAVDGYTLRLSSQPTNGKDLAITVTRDGRPVTDLEPYLATYAHVTAFRQGTLAFAHLHPLNKVDGPGGPTLKFMVEIKDPGTYRLFIQFQTGGVLHTAAVTTTVS